MIPRCDCGAVCVCGECCDYPFVDTPHKPEDCPIFPCYHALLKRDAEVMYQELMSEVYDSDNQHHEPKGNV